MSVKKRTSPTLNMNTRIASIFAVLQLHSQMATAAKVVCYFTSWSQYRTGWGKFLPENIEPFLCTHLVYAFAVIDHAYEITEYEPNEKSLYKSFTELKRRNPMLKTLLSVRVDSEESRFSGMTSSPDSRHTFIQSSVRFLRTHGFDGLDLGLNRGADGVPAIDMKTFTQLCKELSEAFESESKYGTNTRLILSAAVAAQTDVSDTGYDAAELSKYLDFISVKTFHFGSGEDGMTAHHSPLYSGNNASIDHVMRSWTERGAAAQKLLLGFSSYVRAFTISTSAGGLGAKVKGPANPGPYTQQIGVWSYYETCSFLIGASVEWIEDQKVPYAVKGDQWVGFDNDRSIDAKVDYLTSRQLGGAAVWTLDMDDFSGQFCGRGKYPLISHLRQKLSQDFSTLKTTSVAPLPTTTPENAQSTRQHIITAQPEPDSCSQNITVVYPTSSFCTNRRDGVYVKSHSPKAFYMCLRRKTFLTKCHILEPQHNGAVTITSSKGLDIASCVLVTLFHLLRVWINR